MYPNAVSSSGVLEKGILEDSSASGLSSLSLSFQIQPTGGNAWVHSAQFPSSWAAAPLRECEFPFVPRVVGHWSSQARLSHGQSLRQLTTASLAGLSCKSSDHLRFGVCLLLRENMILAFLCMVILLNLSSSFTCFSVKGKSSLFSMAQLCSTVDMRTFPLSHPPTATWAVSVS